MLLDVDISLVCCCFDPSSISCCFPGVLGDGENSPTSHSPRCRWARLNAQVLKEIQRLLPGQDPAGVLQRQPSLVLDMDAFKMGSSLQDTQ